MYLSHESVRPLAAGCQRPGSDDPAFNCQMTRPCGGAFERVMYGWGKNAPLMQLPDGVGYSVGPGSAITTLVLQVGSGCLHGAWLKGAEDDQQSRDHHACWQLQLMHAGRC